MAEDDDRGTLTSAQMADFVLCSPKWLSVLEKDGWIKRNANGRWPTVATVQGRLRQLMDERKRGSQTATLSRVQEARARGIERKNLVAEGRLMDVDEMMQDITEWLGPFVARLGGLPAECTRDLGMRAVIQQKVDAIRSEFADRCEARAAKYAKVRAGGKQ